MEKECKIILDRFEYIIIEYFSGNTYNDYFSIVITYKEKIPNIIIFFVPALISFPNIKVIEIILLINKQIFNNEQCRLNVTQENIDNKLIGI